MANLVRQVGRKAAFELVALGEPIGAERALELGMVNRVVADAELMPHAIAYAEKLAAVLANCNAGDETPVSRSGRPAARGGAGAGQGYQSANAQF
jgi:enoyl-CoA hydratase/carnithine racemase